MLKGRVHCQVTTVTPCRSATHCCSASTCTPDSTSSGPVSGMADSSQGQANGHSEANGTAPTAAGFSLTFGAAKGRGGQPHRTLKPAAKPAKPQAASGFGAEDQSKAGPPIIPKQADTFATERQRAPRFLPTAGQDPFNGLSFEQADAEQDRSGISFGLTVRIKEEPDAQAVQAVATVAAAAAAMQGDVERARFLQGVEEVPEELDPTSAAYETMPIEDFGRAMLLGMGWNEQRAVGKNDKLKPAQAKQYVARPGLLGLGAEPVPQAEKKERRFIRPGDTREGKKNLVYVDESGHQRHMKSEDDKLVERDDGSLKPGRVVHVAAGRHKGLQGTVVALQPPSEGHSQRATVRLEPSEEVVTIRCKELSSSAPEEVHPAMNGSGHRPKHRHSSSHKRGSRERDEEPGLRGSKRHKHSSSTREATAAAAVGLAPAQADSSVISLDSDEGPAVRAMQGSQPREPAWLAPHISVKVVDKHLSKGKLYLKKAEVIDVTEPRVCSIYSKDIEKAVHGIHQNLLETVVPHEAGSRLLIVRGEHRGQRARLLKRNSRSQAVAVQLTSDLSQVVNLGFDDVSHFVGEAGEEE